MKTYVKKHTNRKAALTHIQKIKARGGTHTLFEENGIYTIAYNFPEKKVKKNVGKKMDRSKTGKVTKAKKNKMLFDILSPDGFTIRMPGDELFDSRKQGLTYFNKWKKRYEQQGYYSSNNGRILLVDLADECSWREVPADKADSWLGFAL